MDEFDTSDEVMREVALDFLTLVAAQAGSTEIDMAKVECFARIIGWLAPDGVLDAGSQVRLTRLLEDSGLNYPN